MQRLARSDFISGLYRISIIGHWN